jgi:hypothetical protein
LDHAHGALVNRANIDRLLARLTDLMGLIAGKAKPGASSQQLAPYRKLMGRFTGLLKSAEQYCKQYTQRTWLARMVTSMDDKREYAELVETLKDLTVLHRSSSTGSGYC